MVFSEYDDGHFSAQPESTPPRDTPTVEEYECFIVALLDTPSIPITRIQGNDEYGGNECGIE